MQQSENITEYIAHTANDGRDPQPLITHLHNVGVLAEKFAETIGYGPQAQVIGIAHDIGKYSREFQQYIRGHTGRVDHSTSGAKLLFTEQRTEQRLVEAICISGHHAGLPDFGKRIDTENDTTFMGRMKRQTFDCSEYKKEVNFPKEDDCPFFYENADDITRALQIRMLFSCLVDADFLDTEAYMLGEVVVRGEFRNFEDLYHDFFSEVERKGFFDPINELNAKRRDILQRCIKMGEEKSKLFSLTVPTGGGKTVSAFAFALTHARKYHKKRIIYVIPYTSIIEQTVNVLRSFLGDNSVIEHHSQVEYDDTNEQMNRERLATENWDAPVIVTSNVQFFESLFANRPSKCRKLHNIANSIILFDEAQMFPVRFMKPVVKAIESLVTYFNCTAVLMSATQPYWQHWFHRPVKEMMTNIPALYTFFRRTSLVQDGEKTYEEVAQEMRKVNQALCIALTKDEATKIFGNLPEGAFYLSTNLCPAHREKVIAEMKRRLQTGESCHVISTSIISVGVDIDFPIVFIQESGLDSIIQGAGRCNREGRHPVEKSYVHIFRTKKSADNRFMRQERQCSLVVSQQVEDLAGPEAVRLYFQLLYEAKDSLLDDQDILSLSQEFSFAEIGNRFHLIEDKTKSIFIPWNEEAKKIEKQLRMGIRTRELFRKAGRYMVNVYSHRSVENPGIFENVVKDGYADQLDDESFAILKDMNLYDNREGFVYTKESGKGIMI